MIKENIDRILSELPSEVTLVAVSKFHPCEAIVEAFNAGVHRFGENRPQEFSEKVSSLQCNFGIPRESIEWHFIGHLQTNKLKLVLPYADIVESVDSLHLLQSIDSWGNSYGKKISVLLELHIGAEETKQGFVEEEILDILFRNEEFKNIRFCGLMGMATHSANEADIRADFGRISFFMDYIEDLFPELEDFRQLSIGMSGDWKIALDYGATIVRIGTSIFGEREY